MKNGTCRGHVKIGSRVDILQKKHRKLGVLTFGVVERLLTNYINYPNRINV
ncbi:DUF2196 domain-containing protein [Tenacibaculum aestuariivivum]|uniref:DUF2196 domain-containing protein n=1 Tax=Tenacibaculum aestuariivivum TaxID=2006131 RepID=UPI003AB336A1